MAHTVRPCHARRVSTNSAIVVAALVALSGSVAAEPTGLDRLLDRTDEVAKEVEGIRGLKLRKPIAHEVVDRDELHKRLLALATEPDARARVAAEGFALARWGVIPRSLDYDALLLDLMTEQVAGYYDP